MKQANYVHWVLKDDNKDETNTAKNITDPVKRTCPPQTKKEHHNVVPHCGYCLQSSS
jgi:hypothetical protein